MEGIVIRRRRGDGTTTDRHVPADLVDRRDGHLEVRYPTPTKDMR